MRLALLLLLPAISVGLSCGSGHQSSGRCDGGCAVSTPDDEAFLTSFCELAESCCQKNGRSNLAPLFCKEQLRRLGFSRSESLRATCLAELQRAADGQCLSDLS